MKNFKPLIIIITILILWNTTSSSKIYINGSNSGDLYNMEIPDTENSYSYLIYTPQYDAQNVYAKNGITGKIDFRGNISNVILSIGSNKTVKILPGNYTMCSNPIYINDNTIVSGSGIGITNIYEDSSCTVPINAIYLGDYSILSEISLHGANVANVNGITALRKKNPTIKNVEVENFSAYSITVSGTNMKITNNIIHNTNQYCISTSSDTSWGYSSGTVEGNICYDFSGTGIKLRKSNGISVRYNNITISRPPCCGVSQVEGIRFYDADAPNIFNNVKSNTLRDIIKTNSIAIAADYDLSSVNNGNVISDNTIEGTYDGINIYWNTYDIRNNRINNTRNTGIQIMGSHNYVIDNRLDYSGIVIGNGVTNDHNVITNNYIYKGNSWYYANTSAIYLYREATQNNIITQNYIYGNNDGIGIKTDTYAGTPSNNIIQSNYIFDKLTPISDNGINTILENNYGASPYNFGIISMTSANRVLSFGANDLIINSSHNIPNLCQSTSIGDNWVYSNNGTLGC